MRESVFRWMSFILFIGHIPAFSDNRHRSWSDRMANTVVVVRQAKRRRFGILLAGSACILCFFFSAAVGIFALVGPRGAN
jgi:hypothetical protein